MENPSDRFPLLSITLICRVILIFTSPTVITQCTYSQAQIAQLNAAVNEYEELIHDYKVQVG